MNVLGFDTSTAASAVCVLRADGEEFEHIPRASALTGPPAHGRELLPAIARLLEDADLGWDEIERVALGVGPGAFTGLRVGVATARALARTSGAELRPVSSLAALAAGLGEGFALPMIDARRGEVFAALFEDGGVVWPAFAGHPEAVAERARAAGFDPIAGGSGAVQFTEELEAAGLRVVPRHSSENVVRGLWICRLGRAADPVPPEAVLPDYLRLPDAKPPQ